MKKLIINADDFGLDSHTVERTIKGFECEALTSATIMAGMPGTDAAIAYAKAHPEFSFGVHFYLVDETPMCEAKDIPSMVDPKTGKLWVTRQFILRNFAGLIKVDDLVREMSAQYNAIASTGLKISHVDGHGHNHRLPQSIKALKELEVKVRGAIARSEIAEGLREQRMNSPSLESKSKNGKVKTSSLGLGLQTSTHLRVRRTQDIFCGKPGLLSRAINGPMQRRLASAGFSMTNHFAMNAGHTDDPMWFSHLLATLPDGITEIGIHPGDNEPWRTIDTTDCFTPRDWSGIARITFNDLK